MGQKRPLGGGVLSGPAKRKYARHELCNNELEIPRRPGQIVILFLIVDAGVARTDDDGDPLECSKELKYDDDADDHLEHWQDPKKSVLKFLTGVRSNSGARTPDLLRCTLRPGRARRTAHGVPRHRARRLQ